MTQLLRHHEWLLSYFYRFWSCWLLLKLAARMAVTWIFCLSMAALNRRSRSSFATSWKTRKSKPLELLSGPLCTTNCAVKDLKTAGSFMWPCPSLPWPTPSPPGATTWCCPPSPGGSAGWRRSRRRSTGHRTSWNILKKGNFLHTSQRKIPQYFGRCHISDFW